MKRFLAIVSVLLFVFVFSACDKKPIEVTSFSYEQDMQYFSGVGAKTDGFKNTSETEVKTAEQALELCKNEVTVTYNQVSLAFDSEKKIWKVSFWTENQGGGNQTVYLTSKGITILCIYGE